MWGLISHTQAPPIIRKNINSLITKVLTEKRWVAHEASHEATADLVRGHHSHTLITLLQTCESKIPAIKF